MNYKGDFCGLSKKIQFSDMVLLKLKSSNQKQPDYTEDNMVIFIIQQRWDRKIWEIPPNCDKLVPE